MGVLQWLFGPGNFMAHKYCYLSNPALIRLHLWSDLLIGVAYVAISLTLVYMVRKGRQDIPFHRGVAFQGCYAGIPEEPLQFRTPLLARSRLY